MMNKNVLKSEKREVFLLLAALFLLTASEFFVSVARLVCRGKTARNFECEEKKKL